MLLKMHSNVDTIHRVSEKRSRTFGRDRLGAEDVWAPPFGPRTFGRRQLEKLAISR